MTVRLTREHELVLASLHGLRSHQADVKYEFAITPSDDDPSISDEVGELISGVGGGVGGAALGGRFAGTPELITGALVGAGVGGRSVGTKRAAT
jgi:hypothetical protein